MCPENLQAEECFLLILLNLILVSVIQTKENGHQLLEVLVIWMSSLGECPFMPICSVRLSLFFLLINGHPSYSLDLPFQIYKCRNLIYSEACFFTFMKYFW